MSIHSMHKKKLLKKIAKLNRGEYEDDMEAELKGDYDYPKLYDTPVVQKKMVVIIDKDKKGKKDKKNKDKDISADDLKKSVMELIKQIEDMRL